MTLPRLSDRTFAACYDRAALKPGIVHLGLGAFHRAHQAPLFDQLAAQGDLRWGITGVAMRSPKVVQALSGQDGLYSLSIRGEGATAPSVIASLRGLLIVAEDPDAVMQAIAAPDTHLVTLTVTEKGYLDHGPASAAGLIARALDRRLAHNLGPMTVLSCDNLAGNGMITRATVLAAAQAAGIADRSLDWIERECAFPSSMVDRITPATTPAMIADSSAALGLQDAAALWTEPFWQWAVEDRFAAARPALEALGVEMVDDVAPWERAKLRLLNGAHSALAYTGLLRGHVYVHEAIGDPALRRLVEALWDEAAQVLQCGSVDIPAYRSALLGRFANPALPHALIQIAADGSQKLPPRLLSTFAERTARGWNSPAIASAIAAWVCALATIDGLADPMLDILRPIARSGSPSWSMLTQLLRSVAGGEPDVRMIGQIVAAPAMLDPSGAAARHRA